MSAHTDIKLFCCSSQVAAPSRSNVIRGTDVRLSEDAATAEDDVDLGDFLQQTTVTTAQQTGDTVEPDIHGSMGLSFGLLDASDEGLDAMIASAEEGLKDSFDDEQPDYLDNDDGVDTERVQQAGEKLKKRAKDAKRSKRAKKRKDQAKHTEDDEVRASSQHDSEGDEGEVRAKSTAGRQKPPKDRTGVVHYAARPKEKGAIERPQRKGAGEINRMDL